MTNAEMRRLEADADWHQAQADADAAAAPYLQRLQELEQRLVTRIEKLEAENVRVSAEVESIKSFLFGVYHAAIAWPFRKASDTPPAKDEK